MLSCTLFGQTITFQDPAERFFDLQYAEWTAHSEAKRRFWNWYDKCGNIETVLHKYEEFTETLVDDLAVKPLFNDLRKCDIYDVSRDAYRNFCVDYEETENALKFVAQKYAAIEEKREADAEYRAARKASRGRWQGGGFGFSGAVKGAAMAGGMNLLSGMGHSVINAVGNAGSSMEASSAMRRLYTQSETREILFDALADDLANVFFTHIDLVNKYRPGYISEPFDPERAEALFESAKAIANKRCELLIQALSLCPWNAELVRYIFINYPEERRAIRTLAHRFHVDLSAAFEALLEKEYPEEDRDSEEAAQRDKAKIRTIMAEYRIEESATLDKLECDCLERICNGCESADKDTCLAMREKLQRYDALEKNKAAYLERVSERLIVIWNEELSALCAGYEQADEAACGDMKAAVQAYDAPEEQKEPFLNRLQQRVEEIWSAEDGALFEKLYLATDITDSDAVAKALEEIKQTARTAASARYISALETCTEKEIHKARLFRLGVRPRVYGIIGGTFFLLGVSNLFFLHLGILATILCIVVSIVFAGLYTDLSDPWDKLTLKGTVFHPVLTSGLPQPQKQVPSFVIALLITAVLTGLWIVKGNNLFHGKDTPSVSDPVETTNGLDFTEEPTQTPDSEDIDAQLARDRLDYMVIGADGNSYNRYLGLNRLVYWYYDDTVDEEGTAELAALNLDANNVAAIFDYAISQGIDANEYIAAYSDDPDANIASEPTEPEDTGENTMPPEIMPEELSAAIASVLPAEIGTFRTGSGVMDYEKEPGCVRISHCELNSTAPAIFDVSMVTAEVLMRWTDAYAWELESIRFDGSVRLGIAGSYTVSNFGETRSADVTIGSDAALDSDGSLVFQNVTVHLGDYMAETSLTVEVMDDPGSIVATLETGSVYQGHTPDNTFYLYFDADMMPTFFYDDP